MRLTSVLIAIALAVVLTACGGASVERRDDAALSRTDAAPSAFSAPETEAAGAAAAGGGVDDGGVLGSAGHALLSPSTPAAVVEVDQSPAASLSIDPRAAAGEELREHGGKQSVRAAGDSRVPGQQVYSPRDLRAITAAARSTRSSADQVAIYILVLEGRYENENVTGVAFGATAFAVFPDQIGGPLLGLQREAFERAVVVHELGHLFGLVDLTGLGDFHEDPQHPNHAASEDSVMYWAVEDVSLRNVFRGGPPTEFDAADRKEMSRIRASSNSGAG